MNRESDRCQPCGAPLGDRPKCEYCQCKNPSATMPSLSAFAGGSVVDAMMAARQRNELSSYQALAQCGMGNLFSGIIGGSLGGPFR